MRTTFYLLLTILTLSLNVQAQTGSNEKIRVNLAGVVATEKTPAEILIGTITKAPRLIIDPAYYKIVSFRTVILRPHMDAQVFTTTRNHLSDATLAELNKAEEGTRITIDQITVEANNKKTNLDGISYTLKLN